MSITAAASILAIESSHAHCSAAIWRDGRVAAQRQVAEINQQAAQLLPCIEGALQDAGIDYAGLDLIACTLGPGSFTSIRIGLATARAIALATGLPLHGYGSLRLLAWQAAQQAGVVAVATNAYRGQVYYQRFEGGDPIGQPEALPHESLVTKRDNALCIGDGWALAGIEALELQPAAAALAALAASAARPDGTEPIYVREPDARAQKAPPAMLAD